MASILLFVSLALADILGTERPMSLPMAPSVNKCKLPAGVRMGEGFESRMPYAPSVGVLKGAMFFVDFPDAPANDTAPGLHSILMPHAATWFNTSSYGRLNFQMQADTSKFHRMPQNSTYYNFIRNAQNMKGREYIGDAIKSVGTSFNFDAADVLYIVPTRRAEAIPFSPTFPSPRTMANGVKMRNVVTIGQDLHLKFGYKGTQP
jgi:hypothetical protein